MKKILSIVFVLMAFVAVSNASTKTTIKTTDLSKAITNDISKNFSGYTIKEAYKVDTNGVISYEVLVQKANEQWNLFYDKDGKLLKKEAVSNSVASKKAPAQSKSESGSKAKK